MKSNDLIAYVFNESRKIGVAPIAVYSRAKISGGAIKLWMREQVKTKQHLRFRIERAINDIASQRGITRQSNPQIYEK